MDNWPTRPDHYEVKERLHKYDDLVELDVLIDKIAVDLKQKTISKTQNPDTDF